MSNQTSMNAPDTHHTTPRAKRSNKRSARRYFHNMAIHHLNGLIKYDECTDEELNEFMKNRGISLSQDPYAENMQRYVVELDEFFQHRGKSELPTKPVPALTRYAAIGALESADQDRTFRFLDLLPEIRNMVYRELLHLQHDPEIGTNFCWPQILAACKQTHAEGGGIMGKENAAIVNIEFYWVGDLHRSIPPSVTVNGVDLRWHEPGLEFSFKNVWPESLLKAAKIRIECSLRERSGEKYKWVQSSSIVLIHLRNFLWGSTTLQHIHVNFVNTAGQDRYVSSRMSDLLSPLRSYGRQTTFNFVNMQSCRTNEIVDAVKTANIGLRKDIFEAHLPLRLEALAFFNAVAPRITSRSSSDKVSLTWATFQTMWSIERWVVYPLRWEDDVRSAALGLETALNQVDVNKLGRMTRAQAIHLAEFKDLRAKRQEAFSWVVKPQFVAV